LTLPNQIQESVVVLVWLTPPLLGDQLKPYLRSLSNDSFPIPNPFKSDCGQHNQSPEELSSVSIGGTEVAVN